MFCICLEIVCVDESRPADRECLKVNSKRELSKQSNLNLRIGRIALEYKSMKRVHFWGMQPLDYKVRGIQRCARQCTSNSRQCGGVLVHRRVEVKRQKLVC